MLFVLSADIGACESIMKKKTKQDFQELIKTEHGNSGGRAWLLPMLPLILAPSHPAKMFSGSFQLMLAGWNAGSCYKSRGSLNLPPNKDGERSGDRHPLTQMATAERLPL